MSAQPVISIVIPVFNSENCLLKLTQEVERVMTGFAGYELIFVNDKSTDNSWAVISGICRSHKNVSGVCLKKNAGQDNAILTGLRIASGSFVVIMDDDLQHSPADITKLYEKCGEGYDVCFGLFPEKKHAMWKRAGSWLNGKLAEFMLDKPGEIYLSPFKIIRKAVADKIIRIPMLFPYIDAALLSVTSNITQVEVTHYPRHSGKSNYDFLSSALVFAKYAANYSIFPERIFSSKKRKPHYNIEKIIG